MKPIVLAILDGWGYSKKKAGNPMQEALKPTFDHITAHYPMTLLQASGLAVGLPWGNYGNSEVGHLTIGAGRIVQQYDTRIQNAIKDESFFSNTALLGACDFAKQHGGKVHIIGLLTAGTVHADFAHILALDEFAKRKDVQAAFHLFSDGKDSNLQEGVSLLQKLPFSPTTLIGRNFAMDRDNNWELTDQAHDLISIGKGADTDDFVAKLQALYAEGMPDTKIPALKRPDYTGLATGDALIFFNFREDSMRQIFQSFIKDRPQNTYICSMTQYSAATDTPFAFGPPNISNNLAEVLSGAGMTQLHIAETLKYAHVTYFFNGLRDEPYAQEKNILVPSVKDIEAQPEMKAAEIADQVVAAIQAEGFAVIIVNFANADMLAHTGNYAATVAGVQAVDAGVGRIMEAVLAKDGILAITADHANAEELIDPITSKAESRHGDGPVPFYLIGKAYQDTGTLESGRSDKQIGGILADVAPTILDLCGLPKPAEMTGLSLLPELLGQRT